MASAVLTLGCSPDRIDLPVELNGNEGAPHPAVVVLSPPDRSGVVVESGGSDVAIPCGTCHATRDPNLATRSSEELDQFHSGLEYAHGDLSCLSCHDHDDPAELRLADGRSLPARRSIELCAQCHGPQYRDYSAGSHGGGSGYWDKRQGSLVRNHCLHCHDPHAPSFPAMQPTFKPKDRFLDAPSHESPDKDSAKKENHG